MTATYRSPDGRVALYLGDCVDVMRTLDDETVDAVVTDPPYNLSFMGRAWDQKGGPEEFERWCELWGREALRVLKPGGHLVAFGGTRTYHRLASGIEDAGFELRDGLAWLYGQGYPKSLDVSKAIDKHLGAERPRDVVPAARSDLHGTRPWMADPDHRFESAEPVTPEAAEWKGYGTALKPAWEPAVVGRKRLTGSVAENVLQHRVGGLNIDAGRIAGAVGGGGNGKANHGGQFGGAGEYRGERPLSQPHEGRWPPNVMLSHLAECVEVGERKIKSSKARVPSGSRERQSGFGMTDGQGGYGDDEGRETVPDWRCAPGCPVLEVDAQSGVSRSGSGPIFRQADKFRTAYGEFKGGPAEGRLYGDEGGASRFFYVAKADQAERRGSRHPTVKPLDLMRQIVRLVSPPGGLVLDPFAGSCSTLEAAYLEGMRCGGIDRDEASLRDVQARIVQSVMLL